MGKIGRIFACALTLIAAVAAQTSVAEIPGSDNPPTLYNTIVVLARANECQQAIDLLATPSSTTQVASLSGDVRLAIDKVGLYCALRTKQPALALKFADEVTALPNAPPAFWLERFSLDWNTADEGRAVTTLEAMAATSPEALDQIDVDDLATVSTTLILKRETALRQRLIKVLGSPTYKPNQPGRSVDGYRYEDAALEEEAGSKERAAAIFASIESPSLLIRASLDPRLRAMVPASFDARAAVERDIDRLREIVASHPFDMRPVLSLAGDYLNLDDGQEMLTLLLPIQRGKSHPEIRGTRGDAFRWWVLMSDAYTVLGRYEEAVATIRQSMEPGEVRFHDAGASVSLASEQLRFGHASQALASLALLDQPANGLNLFGEMQRHETRGCASFLAGNTDLATADLAYLTDHHSDAPDSSFTLAMCMHRDDEAAAHFIKRLADPDQVAAALVTFSTFSAPPVGEPRDWYSAAIARLKNRPDIRAAIKKAGGAGNFDIPPL